MILGKLTHYYIWNPSEVGKQTCLPSRGHVKVTRTRTKRKCKRRATNRSEMVSATTLAIYVLHYRSTAIEYSTTFELNRASRLWLEAKLWLGGLHLLTAARSSRLGNISGNGVLFGVLVYTLNWKQSLYTQRYVQGQVWKKYIDLRRTAGALTVCNNRVRVFVNSTLTRGTLSNVRYLYHVVNKLIPMGPVLW